MDNPTGQTSGTEGQTPGAEGQTPAPGTTGLPSDRSIAANQLDGFQFNDEFIAENFKDGKLRGRFTSIQEVLDKLKEAEDFKANTIRDQKNAADQQTQQQQTAEQQAQVMAAQQSVIQELVPQFMQNGMQLTPEMEAKAVEVGIDVRDLKLGAIEFRDRIEAAHKVVGGAEEYNAMLQWAGGVLTDAQKAAFDADVTSGAISEFAIRGLHSQYREAVKNGNVGNQGRIEGQGQFTGIKPYADRRELFQDKAYIDSPAGQRDTAAQRRYRERLAVTSNEVIYGR